MHLCKNSISPIQPTHKSSHHFWLIVVSLLKFCLLDIALEFSLEYLCCQSSLKCPRTPGLVLPKCLNLQLNLQFPALEFPTANVLTDTTIAKVWLPPKLRLPNWTQSKCDPKYLVWAKNVSFSPKHWTIVNWTLPGDILYQVWTRNIIFLDEKVKTGILCDPE